jgi:hypothetical protein
MSASTPSSDATASAGNSQERSRQLRSLIEDRNREVAELRRNCRKLGPIVLPFWLLSPAAPFIALIPFVILGFVAAELPVSSDSLSPTLLSNRLIETGGKVFFGWIAALVAFYFYAKGRNSRTLQEIDAKLREVENLNRELSMLS